MKILVEPSDFTFQNIGDTAMLQIAVKRLKALFPDSSLYVFTEDPEGLKFFCPDAIPFSTTGRLIWLADRYLLASSFKFLNHGWITEYLCGLEKRLHLRWPSIARHVIQYSLRRRGIPIIDLNDYFKAISEADLVIVSGMGGITDEFLSFAFGVLATLALAVKKGVPTAMLGQGIGPIRNSELRARAKEVLPQINFISLRESRASFPLINSLDVPPDHVMVTGDDTIELAFQLRSAQLGKGLGVNLRAAYYSQVDQLLIQRIRPVIQDFASLNATPLVPIPISRVTGEEDDVTIQHLIAGHKNTICSEEDLNTPIKVIKQIQHCRVVVTGSYHAAVFALAMGIPAVSLAKSEYYIDKFLGLAELFGTGCQVVFLNDMQMPAKLHDAIDRMWKSAEQIRPRLLKAAADQVELSHIAYQRLCTIVSSKATE